MEKVAALSEPDSLVLRTLQAVSGLLGLLPEPSHERTWDEVKAFAEEPKALLAKLMSFDVAASPEQAVKTLSPFFAEEDFRPNCVALAAPVACADLCNFCLAVYICCGGSEPPPAPAAVMEKLEKAKNPPAHELPDPVEEQEPDKEEEEEEALPGAGGLHVLALSGEELACLTRARPEWSRAELRKAVAKARPLNSRLEAYDFIHGNERVARRVTLADLGLDPQKPEGCEITTVIKTALSRQKSTNKLWRRPRQPVTVSLKMPSRSSPASAALLRWPKIS